MEPPGGARHRWENREVEWAGAHESKRQASEFQHPQETFVSISSFPFPLIRQISGSLLL